MRKVVGVTKQSFVAGWKMYEEEEEDLCLDEVIQVPVILYRYTMGCRNLSNTAVVRREWMKLSVCYTRVLVCSQAKQGRKTHGRVASRDVCVSTLHGW